MKSSKTRAKASTKASAQLRIIGGRHRGRKLPILDRPGLRPTADRIRETLFNWLQLDIAGATTLDLFAGTGALGLEALSRDAKTVTFVEADGQVARSIRESLSVLKESNGKVVNSTAQGFLSGVAQPFDLVFIDPPFAENLWNSSLALLSQPGWLMPGALVYVECPKQAVIETPADWQLLKDKTGGQVRFRLYQTPE